MSFAVDLSQQEELESRDDSAASGALDCSWVRQETAAGCVNVSWNNKKTDPECLLADTPATSQALEFIDWGVTVSATHSIVTRCYDGCNVYQNLPVSAISGTDNSRLRD